MTPCAKGDEAETEEIFLPIQKKREKHSSENKRDSYCTKGKKKAKRKQNRENKRQKSDMKKKHIVCKHY